MFGDGRTNDVQHVVVQAPLREGIAAAGPQHPERLGDGDIRSAEVHDAERTRDAIERAAVIGQRLGIGFPKRDRWIVPARFANHGRCEIDPLDNSTLTCERRSQMPRPAAHIERARAVQGRQCLDDRRDHLIGQGNEQLIVARGPFGPAAEFGVAKRCHGSFTLIRGSAGCPSGGSRAWAATDREVRRLEKWLGENQDVAFYTSYVGAGSPRFYLPTVPELANANFGQVIIMRRSIGTRPSRTS